jgi:hypothetical protein
VYVDAVVTSARYVLSLTVCRVVWRVSLRCLERIVVWVQRSSAHRSISYVVVILACRMIPNSVSTFLYRMLVIILWYAMDCHIRVCYWGCVMLMLRRDCLFLYTAHVHGFLLLVIFQSAQRMTCYVFCMVIYIFHWSLFCFVVIYRVVDCIWCYMFEMLRSDRRV